MECEHCASEMSAYLDGELENGRVAEMETHVRACVTCAEELQSLKDAALFVDSNSPELEVRPEIWDKVQARIHPPSAPESTEGWLQIIFGRRWLAAGAAAALVLTMGTWGYFRYQESERELARYMAEYIRARDHQEQVYGSRVQNAPADIVEAALEHPESADNPFAVVQFSPNNNPFRSEDR